MKGKTVERPKFKTKYTEHKRITAPKGPGGRTKQSFKDECDINNIMRKYKQTGQLPNARPPGQGGDFTGFEDYHDSLNRIIAAQDSFMSLPALTRKRFANDPGEFLEFINDPKNIEEAEKMGLLKIVKHKMTEEIPPEKGGKENSPEPGSDA